MIQILVSKRCQIDEIIQKHWIFDDFDRLPPLSSWFGDPFPDRFLDGLTVSTSREVLQNSMFSISEPENLDNRPNNDRKLFYFEVSDQKKWLSVKFSTQDHIDSIQVLYPTVIA